MNATPAEILRSLTLAQKASLTSGADYWHIPGIDEAGVPPMRVADGPHGLRRQPGDADAIGIGESLPATCFPPAVALASSWDLDLIRRIGEALGAEARAAQVSVLLGPGVNIKRTPLCGRNFEYFSEDPFLSGRAGAAYVHGVQSQGVGASLKHFAANNQETDRIRISADVDERTLREIYLPAFEHVVRDARPATVMCSYNRLNGTHASENHWLLTTLLRDEWGFEGLVVSDWGAVADRVRSVAAGLDVQMPPTRTDHLVVEAVQDGRLAEDQVDAAARRVLELHAALPRPAADARFDPDEHHRLARAAAASCAVLLKNESGLLPLDPSGTARIAVIGEFARTPRYQGAGSSQVRPTRLDTALDAITAAAGDRVTFAPGFTLDGSPVPALAAEAVETARNAEVAVLFLGLPPAAESEGLDRTHLDLPADQLALLAAVHEVNPHTVVVLSNGAVVSVSEWQHNARAILEGWLLGQAGGSATADVLFGHAEPTGRLAETIPLRLEDTPAHLYFPGGEQHVRYGEGLYVGYRHYDTLEKPVAYPFGFGLGYTTFELGGLTVTPAGDNAFDVTLQVTNTGARTGTQTVQIYVHDVESSLDRPVHELKGFAKTTLAPGETGRVGLHLDERAFAFWSVAEHRWKIEAGLVEIRAGFSSRDIRARHRAEIAGDRVPTPLDAMSTLDEWLAHPVAAPLLRPFLSQSALWSADLTPTRRKIIGAMPMAKLATFGVGISPAQLADLMRHYRAQADAAS
ncbi:glycoside hydrolase family 3 C-terminal domain-containing protein [Spirillospora sp. CA-294931]|uniref:glycoside hydrolase family 3 C-terminal domain-containing protein n=1 Tax=Spirillospora sp. CA-294931 TaxID=3240042 RepID=UPI003D8C3E8F